MRHVLILRALGLGDFLTGVPAYRGLRSAYPDAVLTLAAPAYLQPLLPLTGAVDRLLATESLGRLLPTEPGPDLAVNLHGRGPESIDDLRGSGATKLITHRHPLRPQVAGPDWLRMYTRFIAGAGSLTSPASPVTPLISDWPHLTYRRRYPAPLSSILVRPPPRDAGRPNGSGLWPASLQIPNFRLW